MLAGERCELNFGQRPLAHPLPGYRPLVDPPGGAAGAAWLLACLRRLALLLVDDNQVSPAVQVRRRVRMWAGGFGQKKDFFEIT